MFRDKVQNQIWFFFFCLLAISENVDKNEYTCISCLLLCVWDLSNNSQSRRQAHTVPRRLLHPFLMFPLLNVIFTFSKSFFPPKIWFHLLWNKTCQYWWKLRHESMTGASTVRPGGGGAQQRANCYRLSLLAIFLFFFIFTFHGAVSLTNIL